MTKFFAFVFTTSVLAFQPLYSAVLVLNNGTLTVKTDNAYGGAITWLSISGGLNLVNTYDLGRLVQQSFYAGRKFDRRAAGQSPAWSPWQWNPVQGGSFNGTRSTVNTFTSNNNVLYSWTSPKLWDMPNETAQAVMKQWTEFEPNKPSVIRVTNQFVCQRSATDVWGGPINHHQELPACYFVRALNTVKIYRGGGVWDAYAYPLLSTTGWGRPNPPKKTMAFFLPNGTGIAIYSPKSNTAWNCGGVGTSASTSPSASDTMHVAPLATVALDRTTTYTFKYWLIIGDQATITARVDELLTLYPNG